MMCQLLFTKLPLYIIYFLPDSSSPSPHHHPLHPAPPFSLPYNDHRCRLPVAVGSTTTSRQRRRPSFRFPSLPSTLSMTETAALALFRGSTADLSTAGIAAVTSVPLRRRCCPTGFPARGQPKDIAIVGSPGVLPLLWAQPPLTTPSSPPASHRPIEVG